MNTIRLKESSNMEVTQQFRLDRKQSQEGAYHTPEFGDVVKAGISTCPIRGVAIAVSSRISSAEDTDEFWFVDVEQQSPR